MDEVELQLQSEDHGKDLASVTHLLKRHSLLEGDVSGHSEAVEQVKYTAAAFQSSDHFMGDEMQERALAVIRRSVLPFSMCTSKHVKWTLSLLPCDEVTY